MTAFGDAPDPVPGAQVREAANVAQSLVQLATLRRDMIERRHLEAERERQRQLERAERRQEQEERDTRTRAERDQRDQQMRDERDERDTHNRAERQREQEERDVRNRTERETRDKQMREERETRDKQMRDERDQRDTERRAEIAARDTQRTADAAARDADRRRARLEQLSERAERARRGVNDAIHDLTEAERHLAFLRSQSDTAKRDHDQARGTSAPEWEIRRLRDTAHRAAEQARQGAATVEKVSRRVETTTAEYDRAVNAFTQAQAEYDESLTTPDAEAPDAEFRTTDPEAAEAVEAAKRVVVPDTPRTTGPTTNSPDPRPAAAPDRTHTDERRKSR